MKIVMSYIKKLRIKKLVYIKQVYIKIKKITNHYLTYNEDRFFI